MSTTIDLAVSRGVKPIIWRQREKKKKKRSQAKTSKLTLSECDGSRMFVSGVRVLQSSGSKQAVAQNMIGSNQ